MKAGAVEDEGRLRRSSPRAGMEQKTQESPWPLFSPLAPLM